MSIAHHHDFEGAMLEAVRRGCRKGRKMRIERKSAEARDATDENIAPVPRLSGADSM
jgi:hypothetical protein